MVNKREIGSKIRKSILKQISVPSVPLSRVTENIRFGSEDETSNLTLLYNKNHEITFFKYKDRFLPSLRFIRANPQINLPSVRVDHGAVPHILNGADVFCQGVEKINHDFDAGTIILVFNPQDAVLALGEALINSQKFSSEKGKGIKNIHYLNDRIWAGK
ncbi:MAG: PUA domain-containing protein [Candidatus Heimdallarchaeota archaeon]